MPLSPPAQVNRVWVLLKSRPRRQVRPGSDTAGQGEADLRPESSLRVTQESKSAYSKQVPTERKRAKLWQARPAAFVSQATDGEWVEVAGRAADDWFMGWLAGCEWPCVCAGHTVDDRLARPRMGQAPSAPQAAVMCPFSLHSPQARQTRAVRVIAWVCVRRAGVCVCVSLSLSPSYGCVVSKSEAQSLYLPSTIKVKVCLGGAVAEPCRQAGTPRRVFLCCVCVSAYMLVLFTVCVHARIQEATKPEESRITPSISFQSLGKIIFLR